MLSTISGSCALLCVLAVSYGQTSRFDEVIVRPLDTSTEHKIGIQIERGGRVIASGLSLKMLMCAAFNISHWQLGGGDGWTDKDEYYVEGVPPDAIRHTISNLKHSLFQIESEELRKMLEGVLLERFNLKYRRETSEGAVFVLRRSGKRLKLQSQDSQEQPDAFGSIGYAAGRWVISKVTIGQVAKFASDYIMHAPVIDSADLKGVFSYTQVGSDVEPDYNNNSGSFLRLLGEVGLKLERTRGQVERVMIEHASRPTGN